MIPPDQFLPLCTRPGLNLELTQWVIHTALRHQSEWPNDNTPSIAINVSADIVDSPELPNIITNAVRIWGNDTSKLTIEIIESAIIEDKESGFNNLTKVRALGLKISIDGFGTGYPSLAYFKHIPADEVKIDRSFIDNMVNDSADRRNVELIVSLAKSFDLEVVAEGVENQEQLDLVKSLHCDYAQGYYLSRPISYQDFITWATTNH
jgi:EAL domain-containing protein (putative c-di-GMP-specific phosphodiesterase class I)